LASDIFGATVVSGMKRWREAAFPLFLLLMLPGCQIATRIEVRTIDGVTTFEVFRGDGQTACVQNIKVSEGRGETGSLNKWSLNQNYADIQAGKNACHNVFVYGKPIAGYERTFDGKPLESGKTYYVSVSGGGLSGDRTFTVDK
jgi:hypothetical protein